MTASLQPFQTWEYHVAERWKPDVSLDLLRIRWKAFGDITTAVHVAAHARDPPSDGDEAYSKPGDPPSLHPISESSLTDPPISSITVRIDDLDMREENWLHEHIPHAGDGYDVWEDVDDDDDEIRDLGDGRKLVRCCNEDTPYAPAPLVIQGSTDKGYVTIHDYLVAVHALLHSHRDEIVQHRIIYRGEQHGPGGAELWVDLFSIDRITLSDGKPSALSFPSHWERWTSYVDRKLSGHFPTREEYFRMMQPPRELVQGIPRVTEAVPRSHLRPDMVPGPPIDPAPLLRQVDQIQKEIDRRYGTSGQKKSSASKSP